MRAIKISAEPGEDTRVEAIDIEGDSLEALYAAIGCTTVTGVGYIGSKHCVWGDDEAFYNTHKGTPVFQVDWYNSQVVGTLVVTGFNAETGESEECTLTVGQVSQMVQKVGEFAE